MFRGRTLLNNALGVLRAAEISHLVYVGGNPRLAVSCGASYVSDDASLHDERCMLRGVVSALCSMSSPLHVAVIIACDLPLLRHTTVQRMLAAVHFNDIVVAHGERDHWSCIAVRREMLAHLEASLNAGRRAMHEACSDLLVARVQVDEAEFINVNTRAALDDLITTDVVHGG